MSEVLTQSQIDALLSAGHSSTAVQEVNEEKKIRKYDFNTPKKFTKDRLKLIDGVYENYARRIASYLTSLMRMDVEVELADVEEQRYYEFNNLLGEDDILAFIDANITDDEEAFEPVFLHLSVKVIHGFVDRMLGGTGEEDPAADDSNITEVEMALYEQILSKIVPVMNDVWNAYIESNFQYARLETNPKLIQAIGLDEIVVNISFNIRISEIDGKLDICIPGNILEYIFKKFEETANNMSKKKELQTEEEKRLIFNQIQESELELTAHLDYTYILLSDLFHMRPGDIINLAIPRNSTVTVDVGGNEWFRARMGIYKDNKAIKIESVLDKEPIYNDERL